MRKSCNDTRIWGTNRHLLVPDETMSESVPQVEHLVIATGQELVLVRVRRQSPQLIHVTLEAYTRQ